MELGCIPNLNFIIACFNGIRFCKSTKDKSLFQMNVKLLNLLIVVCAYSKVKTLL